MNKGKGIVMDEWQIEEDLRTLCRAKEILADEKRHAKVKELAKEKMMAVSAVAGGEK